MGKMAGQAISADAFLENEIALFLNFQININTGLIFERQ
jgi:hypothetical protein